MKRSERLVALDIGEVCISVRPGAIVKALGPLGGILHYAEMKELAERLETGKTDPDTCIGEFRRFTGNRFSSDEVRAIWNAMLGPSLPGMAETVRDAVRAGWRFIYFSNTSKIHMDHFFRTNDFCHLVTGAVFSYETGFAKPDARIYEAFESQYGIPALYFDDRQENIDAGLRRGWPSVRFESAAQIRPLLGL